METHQSNVADPMAIARFWEEQAQLYAEELQRIYQSEQNERKALQQAQAQLVIYAEDVRSAFQSERKRRQEIQRAYLDTIQMLAAAVEARDPYTGDHLERVTRYCLLIGRELGMDSEGLSLIHMGAILHDIGKIAIADAILRKPGPLSDEEWHHMRQHADIGAKILRGIAFLEPVVPAVRHHHERYAGDGYPDRLAGEHIPIGGRIIAVADAFDSMTSTRPYRVAQPKHRALDELQSVAGTQLDPQIVEAFLSAVGRDKSLMR